MEATEPADAETHVVNFDEADANGDNVLDLAHVEDLLLAHRLERVLLAAPTVLDSVYPDEQMED